MVVGISGGLDSVVLTHLMHTAGLNLELCHVNYMKRGAESDMDAKFVVEFAKKLGQPVHTLVYSEPSPITESGNFQERARNFRRNFYETTMRSTGSQAIALAHHKDDHSETILMRILRGSGLTALSGMRVFAPPYFRPLLGINKTVLHEYALKHDLFWREDASNFENTYTRNWLRNEFVQELNKRFPGWQEHLAAHSMRSEAFKEILDRHVTTQEGELTRLSLERLSGLSEDAVLIVLAHWLDLNSMEYSRGDLESLKEMLNSSQGSRRALSGFVIQRERDGFWIVAKEVDLDCISVPELGKHILVDTVASKDISLDDLKGPGVILMDAETLTQPLSVRYWEDGDRIRPLGMTGSKLISDILTDVKVVTSEKRKACLICDFDGNPCALIFPHPISNGRVGVIGNRHKVTESTSTVLIIKPKYPL